MVMRVRSLLVGSLLVPTALATGVAGRAAGPELTTRSGVYSAAQAAEGEGVFLDRCAACHQPDLSGGEDAPALAGAQFSAKWNGRSLADLFALISRSMPQDAPGSLTPDDCAAVLAHMLDRNGFPRGTAPLANALPALGAITFSAEQLRR
jgi:alcohol dehydrogenase (cytochrome c)